jgi:hypothetical protein
MSAAIIILAGLALLVFLGATVSVLFDPEEIDREERKIAWRGYR